MEGFTLTQSEIELGHHTLRSFSDRPGAVGAARRQIEGKVTVIDGGFQGALHAPDPASEDFRDVGNPSQEPRISFQQPGTNFHADR